MDPTPKPGESGAPVAPSNEPSTPAAPVVDNSQAVEAARKEAEQATLRANQLANENARLKADQDAAQRKQLEEKEEFKTLYEQTQSQLNEIRETQASQDRAKELAAATDEVFKDYSPNVVELAKTVGLGLSDNSETATASLKEKLDAFQKQVGSNVPTPSSNNPRQVGPSTVNREELVKRNEDGVSPMALAGAKGNDSVIRSYISELPAIARMKEIARNGA